MPLTVRQWNAFLAILVQNVDPDVLDHEVLQKGIIGDPKRAGAEFTRFLQNGCRSARGGLKIKPVPFDPAMFKTLGPEWKLLADEHDARNDGLTEVDFNQIYFVTGLQKEENLITGEEKLTRLKAGGMIRLGATVFYGLWLDYQSQGKNSVLEALHCLGKLTYINFLGDILLAPDGRRCAMCLYFGISGWEWIALCLGYDCWDASDVSAVSPVAS